MGQAKPRQYSAPVQKGYCQVSHKLSQESLRLRSGIVKSFPARQDLFRLSKNITVPRLHPCTCFRV